MRLSVQHLIWHSHHLLFDNLSKAINGAPGAPFGQNGVFYGVLPAVLTKQNAAVATKNAKLLYAAPSAPFSKTGKKQAAIQISGIYMYSLPATKRLGIFGFKKVVKSRVGMKCHWSLRHWLFSKDG